MTHRVTRDGMLSCQGWKGKARNNGQMDNRNRTKEHRMEDGRWKGKGSEDQRISKRRKTEDRSNEIC